MKRRKVISVIYLLFALCTAAGAQSNFDFSGQVSAWTLYSGNKDLPLYFGGRYIPQLNYNIPLKNDHQIDFEASANIYGSLGTDPFHTFSSNGQVKPYRLWARYSSRQFEIRAGLQKLNFGSASMLRPLMWFDQLDPRDPLQLTDGVWGILGRYYFLNNANIWLWSLYGNNERRGWDIIPTHKTTPEFGGRIQLPVPAGEVAFTYNHRFADSRDLDPSIASFSSIPENRYGLDAKFDLVVGLWVEASYSNKKGDLGTLNNQVALNAGADYTFGVGNGLYVAYEQLVASFDEEPFGFGNSTTFSLLSARYPIGLFDNLGIIVYYNWTGGDAYTFLNWQRTFNNSMLYVMAYWNPDRFSLPTQEGSQNIFAGKGIQIMFVFNH